MKKHLFLFIMMLSPMLASAEDVKINETTFPDTDFRNWVLSQDYGKDGVLTEGEIAEVTFMNLFPQNIIAEGHIQSLKGIEYFTAMTKLVCSRNELTELDLSKNTALTWLECYGNHLTELYLSNNPELTYLDCKSNELTTLDVSSCTRLTELNCFDNQLTTLNVSGCSALTMLKCYSNPLTKLNVYGCTSLKTMWVFDNKLSILDVSDCTSLTTLWCDNNQLTLLDVSSNKNLAELRCGENQLTQLEVSKNTLLTELWCEDNQLTALDLSKNKQLTSLRTYHNPINGKSMDALIESLPTVSHGGWCVVLSEDEEDVVTATQVAAAKAKGWISYYWNESAKNWMEYDGQEESLYGEWWLVGWNDGGTYFEVDPNYVSHRNLSIEIPREDYVKAYSMVNQILLGLLTLNGNEMIFGGEMKRLSTEVYCDIMENQFFEDHICDIKSYQLEGKLLKLYYTDNDFFVFTSDLDNRKETENDYRPFVEEGKVWKVGNCQAILDNSVQVVDYYYFDGDTIIDGKTCKEMMCQRFVSPDFSDEYGYWTPKPFLRKVGAWYEEDQKVYFYDEITQSMVIKYDFSLGDNETVDFLNVDGYPPYIIGPKQTGGIKGFKGVYRDIMMGQDINTKTPWLEGVGGLDGPFASVYHPLADSTPDFLMSCVVGDEVIYYNDEYEDGATPAGARKNRFDFTHTPKIQPKTRISRGEEPLDLWSLATNGTQESVYGEYNDLQLGINLDPLDDAYLVSITNDSGKVVYEKTINAGNIVGLNIDISAYAKGRYTVTVENSRESFTGEFETLTTGISDAVRLNDKEKMINEHIYNLQGQRLSRLQKGLNIVNGKKIYIK